MVAGATEWYRARATVFVGAGSDPQGPALGSGVLIRRAPRPTQQPGTIIRARQGLLAREVERGAVSGHLDDRSLVVLVPHHKLRAIRLSRPHIRHVKMSFQACVTMS